MVIGGLANIVMSCSIGFAAMSYFSRDPQLIENSDENDSSLSISANPFMSPELQPTSTPSLDDPKPAPSVGSLYPLIEPDKSKADNVLLSEDQKTPAL